MKLVLQLLTLTHTPVRVYSLYVGGTSDGCDDFDFSMFNSHATGCESF